MDRAALAALSIVGKGDPFERNVCVELRPIGRRTERQIVKTILPYVMQHETALSFGRLGRLDASSCLYKLCRQGARLLAQQWAGDQQTHQKYKRTLLHKIGLLFCFVSLLKLLAAPRR